MSIACVIGNGKSRLNFDLHEIHATMTTYGCNAIYRDFMPNYLISMDILMVCEIIDNRVHYQTNFYTQHNNKIDELQRQGHPINFFHGQRETNDSGNSALLLASKQHDVIYIIGFDYSVEGLVTNVYTGTNNYDKNEFRPASNFQDKQWKTRLTRIVRENPNKQFIRVNGNNNSVSLSYDNYSEITVQQFKEITSGIHI